MHEDLNMRKLSGKWVPKCLNANQKRQGDSRLSNFWNFFRRVTNGFLSRLLTMEETWLYHYDPKTKPQSMEWRQKIPSAKIRWKNSRIDFLGSRRHPPHCLYSKGPIYQRGVLLISAGTIGGHFEGKRRGKFTKLVLFLHDNAPAHRTLATQQKVGFQCLDHPPYSPDLAPSDYHLFPGLKKTI